MTMEREAEVYEGNRLLLVSIKFVTIKNETEVAIVFLKQQSLFAQDCDFLCRIESRNIAEFSSHIAHSFRFVS